MRDNKECHTCDRCGRKIHIIPSDYKGGFRSIKQGICFPHQLTSGICLAMLDEIGKLYDIPENVKFQDFVGVDIRTGGLIFSVDKKISLCYKCKKDFKKFIRNE